MQDLDLQECEINMRVSGISCAGLCFLEGVFLQTESSIFRHARDGSRVKSDQNNVMQNFPSSEKGELAVHRCQQGCDEQEHALVPMDHFRSLQIDLTSRSDQSSV